ncbi:ABC transporter ATP-binding protein [Cyclobacterium jeungdonense]|uniref:ATP-binding cassette domain-containing protein n=1 Tax=Cyclobacterium jeungdonense TaxID=708087 RepID=A0ABT8CA75_9BACT|nr:ATP-binding cassette domain-containing protein [Cyclobacterium jeungdonense]MDN3689420.1 ATP-binding cassette domain-containing protein [Cyclobacterium jeungdonense]
MISVDSIQFAYNKDQTFIIPDFEIKGGEALLVLGKSGSGKTTLLNIMGGLLAPQQGQVLIDGVSVYALKGNKRDKFRGKHIGIIFQKPHILAPLTVEENISLPRFFVNKPSNEKVDHFLSELDILDKKRSTIQTLSEGEAQRVSIARALVNEPKVILADEPTASLDDENAKIVVNLLKEQAAKLNAALLIVTHDQRIKDQIEQRITITRKDL